eukprot:CAMPEP_0203746868 /NCGR_PEP_ID=MMETSP0098-20131031/2186_1 /ASSEMBLY_ACC=CAM_ASM_000208 /TAXON_ID=96639 /ORGANISM=" , Strain NY0313808BC1" /LENGTH=1339 /DNA_ID=CAMNT_0050635121 /DNA_START=462 /DNA_END=4477 /DNA_ORIENTATION=+
METIEHEETEKSTNVTASGVSRIQKRGSRLKLRKKATKENQAPSGSLMSTSGESPFQEKTSKVLSERDENRASPSFLPSKPSSTKEKTTTRTGLAKSSRRDSFLPKPASLTTPLCYYNPTTPAKGNSDTALYTPEISTEAAPVHPVKGKSHRRLSFIPKPSVSPKNANQATNPPTKAPQPARLIKNFTAKTPEAARLIRNVTDGTPLQSSSLETPELKITGNENRPSNAGKSSISKNSKVDPFHGVTPVQKQKYRKRLDELVHWQLSNAKRSSHGIGQYAPLLKNGTIQPPTPKSQILLERSKLERMGPSVKSRVPQVWEQIKEEESRQEIIGIIHEMLKELIDDVVSISVKMEQKEKEKISSNLSNMLVDSYADSALATVQMDSRATQVYDSDNLESQKNRNLLADSLLEHVIDSAVKKVVSTSSPDSLIQLHSSPYGGSRQGRAQSCIEEIATPRQTIRFMSDRPSPPPGQPTYANRTVPKFGMYSSPASTPSSLYSSPGGGPSAKVALQSPTLSSISPPPRPNPSPMPSMTSASPTRMNAQSSSTPPPSRTSPSPLPNVTSASPKRVNVPSSSTPPPKMTFPSQVLQQPPRMIPPPPKGCATPQTSAIPVGIQKRKGSSQERFVPWNDIVDSWETEKVSTETKDGQVQQEAREPSGLSFTTLVLMFTLSALGGVIFLLPVDPQPASYYESIVTRSMLTSECIIGSEQFFSEDLALGFEDGVVREAEHALGVISGKVLNERFNDGMVLEEEHTFDVVFDTALLEEDTFDTEDVVSSDDALNELGREMDTTINMEEHMISDKALNELQPEEKEVERRVSEPVPVVYEASIEEIIASSSEVEGGIDSEVEEGAAKGTVESFGLDDINEVEQAPQGPTESIAVEDISEEEEQAPDEPTEPVAVNDISEEGQDGGSKHGKGSGMDSGVGQMTFEEEYRAIDEMKQDIAAGTKFEYSEVTEPTKLEDNEIDILLVATADPIEVFHDNIENDIWGKNVEDAKPADSAHAQDVVTQFPVEREDQNDETIPKNTVSSDIDSEEDIVFVAEHSEDFEDATLQVGINFPEKGTDYNEFEEETTTVPIVKESSVDVIVPSKTLDNDTLQDVEDHVVSTQLELDLAKKEEPLEVVTPIANLETKSGPQQAHNVCLKESSSSILVNLATIHSKGSVQGYLLRFVLYCFVVLKLHFVIAFFGSLFLLARNRAPNLPDSEEYDQMHEEVSSRFVGPASSKRSSRARSYLSPSRRDGEGNDSSLFDEDRDEEDGVRFDDHVSVNEYSESQGLLDEDESIGKKRIIVNDVDNTEGLYRAVEFVPVRGTPFVEMRRVRRSRRNKSDLPITPMASV